MKLMELLDTLSYGEDYVKKQALEKEIKECYDEDLSLFYASKRIRKILSETAQSEGEEKICNRLTSKLSIIEEKLEEGVTMSNTYRKLQSKSLMDDCRALAEKVASSRKVDVKKSNAYSKVVATTSYFVKNYIDENASLEESRNLAFNHLVKEENSDIEEILS